MGAIDCRCEAVSVSGFIQQLAVSCVSNGYWFYVAGSVPDGKDASRVDAKLIERYGVAVSKWTRERRKRAGHAAVQYIHLGRFFLLLATHGESRFFIDEAKRIRDCRRTPIRCFGYAVSYRGGHAHVRIEREEFRELKARFLELAVHRRAESVENAFRSVPFEPYAPVRRQLLQVWRAVNRARKAAGFAPVAVECIRMRRRIVEPFGKGHAVVRASTPLQGAPCD